MKRLLQINVVSNSGSTGRIMEDIGNLALNSGWESYVAFGRNSNGSSSKELKIGNKYDFYSHVFQTRCFDKHGLGSIKSTKAFIKQIMIINPNVVHLHNIHGYYLNFEYLFNYLKASNIPVVWTLHDCWAFTGHCAHFDMTGCQKWKIECGQCPQKMSYPKAWIDNSKNNFIKKKEIFTTLNNLTIISVSDWLNNLVSKSFLNHFERKRIHNGIDLKVFFPRPKNTIRDKYKINNKFMILGVANVWGGSKGYLDFLELSKLISNEEVIVLVGISRNQIKSLPYNVIGIERTQSTAELAEIYSAADVFVNPTLVESLGMTNIEAQACGTPVVTYATGGCPETVNMNTGYVIDRGNIFSLYEGIQKVKEIGSQYYKKDCLDWVKNNFDKTRNYLEYIKLYQSL